MGILLRSHDELDLGRLTEAQRQTVFRRLGPDPEMQLYGRGIRRRLASMVGGDPRRLELAASLIFSMPGTPIMRYGDEIGMGDDQKLPDRKAVRTPMQWTRGCTRRLLHRRSIVLPAIADGPFGYKQVNVADQRRDPGSLLNKYERFIRTRKECPEFGWGEHQELATGSHNVLAVRCEWRNNAVLSIHNSAARPARFACMFPGREPAAHQPAGTRPQPPAPQGPAPDHLPPYGYRWYRVGPLIDVATREPR